MGSCRGIVKATGRIVQTVSSVVAGGLHALDREMYFWSRYPLSLHERIDAWRNGFLSRGYVLLELSDSDPDDYLDDFTQFVSVRPGVNSDYIDILENKVAFHLASSPHVDTVPELLGTVTSGDFRPESDGPETLSDLVDQHGGAVIKPISGTHGRGVRLVVPKGNQYDVNGERYTSAEFDALVEDLDDVLITERIRQHEYAREIWPESVNTVRVLTVLDPDTGEPFVSRAVHRFGGEGTGPTDNWSSGGVAAPVDEETGELGEVVDYDPESGVQRFDHHPDSGTTVAGKTVPAWDDVREAVLELASLHRCNPYIGWDVVQTEGGPVVLEGNCAPGITSLQLSGGLLEDERVERLLSSA